MERRDSEDNELVIDEDANSSPEDESHVIEEPGTQCNKDNDLLSVLPQIQNAVVQMVPITEARPAHTPKPKRVHSSKAKKVHSTPKESNSRHGRKLQSFRLDALKSFKSTSLSVSN